MIRKYGTVHHGWDPTPTALQYTNKRKMPAAFHFHPVGLAARDGNITLKLPTGNQASYTVMEFPNKAQQGTVVNVPVWTVQSMLKSLRHSQLAILKMDIEGTEFDVIREWNRTDYRVPAAQLLIEFHERYFTHRKGWRKMVPEAVKMLHRLGFVQVHRTKLVRFTDRFLFTCPITANHEMLTVFRLSLVLVVSPLTNRRSLSATMNPWPHHHQKVKKNRKSELSSPLTLFCNKRKNLSQNSMLFKSYLAVLPCLGVGPAACPKPRPNLGLASAQVDKGERFVGLNFKLLCMVILSCKVLSFCLVRCEYGGRVCFSEREVEENTSNRNMYCMPFCTKHMPPEMTLKN